MPPSTSERNLRAKRGLMAQPQENKIRLTVQIVNIRGKREMKLKKSWGEKLADAKGLPRVEKISQKMSKRWGEGTVIIPSPLEVDEIMKKSTEGEGHHY